MCVRARPQVCDVRCAVRVCACARAKGEAFGSVRVASARRQGARKGNAAIVSIDHAQACTSSSPIISPRHVATIDSPNRMYPTVKSLDASDVGARSP